MICDQLISKHVAFEVPKRRSMMPWWNKSCNNAYMAKLIAFEARSTDPDACKRVVRRCRKANRVAYKKWQVKVRSRIETMAHSDSNLWKLAKEIGGMDAAKSSSVPSVDAIAEHFQTKMSNGQGVADESFRPINVSPVVPMS